MTAYLPLWLADRGLSSIVIGELLGAASLCRVVAVPAWGWLADRFGRHRDALAVAALCAACCSASLPAAPGVAVLAALVVAGGIAAASLAPLTDAVTLALAAAGRLDYGRTRAWGSVAYMVATALGGGLLGVTSSAVVPWVLAGAYGVAVCLVPAIPAPPDLVRPKGVPVRTGPLPPAFRWALLATALVQSSHAAYYSFASLHWRAAGIPDGVIGLLFAEAIVAEIALFLWGRRLVEWLGPSRLTALAASAAVVRWTVTAYTVATPVLALVQVLHAATFACQHLSSMQVLRTVPPGRAGFAQTALTSLGFSAPTGVLIWVSGQVYGAHGGAVFLLMAVIGGSALLVAPRLPGGALRR